MKTFKKVTPLMSYRTLVFREMQFGEPWASQVMPSVPSTDRALSAPRGAPEARLAGDN